LDIAIVIVNAIDMSECIKNLIYLTRRPEDTLVAYNSYVDLNRPVGPKLC